MSNCSSCLQPSKTSTRACSFPAPRAHKPVSLMRLGCLMLPYWSRCSCDNALIFQNLHVIEPTSFFVTSYRIPHTLLHLVPLVLQFTRQPFRSSFSLSMSSPIWANSSVLFIAFRADLESILHLFPAFTCDMRLHMPTSFFLLCSYSRRSPRLSVKIVGGKIGLPEAFFCAKSSYLLLLCLAFSCLTWLHCEPSSPYHSSFICD